MRTFQFDDIWMLSHRDQRARKEEFSPNRNLILGRNHTGKSSLIKTLLLTMGAKPKGKLIKWDDDTVSLVTITVNGSTYQVMHQAGYRALFGADDQVIFATGSGTAWGKKFAEITGFNLTLSNQDGQSIPADPKCFFLPFYINQDGSWGSSWDTFESIKQFKSPIPSILDFFTGVRPPEYYEAKSLRDAEQKAVDSLESQFSFLQKARDRFEKTMPFSGPKIEEKNFERDIAQLTLEVTKLNKKQEELRDQAVKERELLSGIKIQIILAEETLKEYDGDARFLRSEEREALVCPVCNAEHAEPFLDLLTYAEDARSLRQITLRLYEDAKKIESKIESTVNEMGELEVHYQKISSLLDTRRGDIQFREVVESRGAEKAFKAFEEERESLQNEMQLHYSAHGKYDNKMKELEDKAKSKKIRDKFRNTYAASLYHLNISQIATSKANLANRPNISGSGGPRSVLAYYSALWELCFGPSGSFLVPMIVDSPNQQGQDDINLPKVIEFVSSMLPKNTQLIFGSEIDTEFVFDKKIVLDSPYNLLGREHFVQAAEKIDPMAKKMYEALRPQKA